jgi:hypothetical protein
MQPITRKEANQIIKTNMRGELAKEVNYYLSLADDEDWEDGELLDYVDALEHYDGSDFYKGVFKREHTRMCRLIKMERQVKEGETVTIFSAGRTRTLKPGQWDVVHSYYQFIE